MVKFHNFASLGGYFLMFQPQKTKKIQKKLVRQFLILADFGHIVNRPNFMVFYPNDPQNCPQIWLTRYQKLRMDLPSSKICLESTYHKYRPQAWSIWELAHLPKSPYIVSLLMRGTHSTLKNHQIHVPKNWPKMKKNLSSPCLTTKSFVGVQTNICRTYYWPPLLQ